MKKISRCVLVLCLLPIAAGCVPPAFDEEPPESPAEWTEPQPTHAPEKISLSRWWRSFRDPALTSVMDAALENNPDAREAEAKIAEARGQEKAAFGALFPQITGNASLGRQRINMFPPGQGLPNTGDFSDVSASLGYEVDVFGKNHKAHKGAKLAERAGEKEHAWAKANLAADVARAYVAMRAQEKQEALARKNLGAQNRTLELTRRLYRAGGVGEFDVERAALETSRTEAEIKKYQRLRNGYFLSLVTLTGLSPSELRARLPATGEIPATNAAPFADAPAAVLAERPDVAAAKLRFLQATSLKESQAAAIFPTISLSSMFGLSGNVLSDPARVWTLSGGVAAPLLDFGRVRGLIDVASARETQAFEKWRKATLQAIQEVETSLGDVARLREEKRELQKAKIHASNALRLAEARYRQGDASLLETLDAERQAIAADAALVASESDASQAIVALYRALGQY